MKVSCETSGAAAGTFYWNLVFTNDTDHDITVDGLPVVMFITDAGLFWNNAGPNMVNPLVPLVLKPGEPAYALLSVPDPGDFGDTPFQYVSWLVVTLAGHDPKLVKTPAPIGTVVENIATPHVSPVALSKL